VQGSRSGLGRLAIAVLPLLTACPQLLKDDFYAASPDDSRAAGPVRDPSVAPETGGSAGVGGDSTLLAPASGSAGSAGNAADAGLSDSTPLSEVQVALNAALVHRYRFDTGATLLDSVGGATAASVGATFSGGAAVLAGTGTGQYIDLPNGLLSGLHDASFEVWVIWDVSDPTKSSAAWQRIFDLGRNPSSVEDQQCELDADGTSLYLTPRTSAPGTLQLKCETCGETRIEAPSLAVGVQVQLVAVLNDEANLLSLYRDGVFVSAQPYPGSISQITNCSARAAPCDWNNWLGRSQHIEDPPFQGRILDFRIYDTALDATLIRGSFAAGPDG
jgi:hypothetical protein